MAVTWQKGLMLLHARDLHDRGGASGDDLRAAPRDLDAYADSLGEQ